MEFIPIKTKVLHPPQDDLLAVFGECLHDLKEGDVVLVSSKVVAIHEGRCVPAAEFNKAQYVAETAELTIPRDYWGSPITITNHAFTSRAGADNSNGDGHVVLLPAAPFASAAALHAYLRETYSLTTLGVIITDSQSVPFRYGAVGVGIGWWGIAPLRSHVGREDLFGRTIKVERSNVIDGLAAGANVVMGEVDEATPIVIARGAPGLTFTDVDTKDELFASFADDTFRVLYERWLLQ